MALLVLGLVVVALAAFVAWPLLREPSAADVVAALTPEQLERLRLREERDGALATLKELEFDHRTGAVSDDDYAELVGEYRARAAAALSALDAATAAAAAAQAASPDAGSDLPVAPAPDDDSAPRDGEPTLPAGA